MELYRIGQEAYAGDLSGNGSRLFGGRWNSEGVYALYVSASRSLALLETLAHTPAKMLQEKVYMLISISVPDIIPLQTVDTKKLPAQWDAFEAHPFTKQTGDNFLLHQKKLLLRVPSALVHEEYNYILNPLHPEMKQVKIVHRRQLKFNTRLIKAF
jgi:RES domain-containing protein